MNGLLRIRFAVWLCVLGAAVLLPARGAGAGTLSDADLRRALVTYLERNAPPGTELIQWDLGRGDVVPETGSILRVHKLPRTPWQSPVALRVEIQTGSGKVQAHWVTAQISCAQGVVVALRTLPMGHVIGHGDVRLESHERRHVDANTYASLHEVIGKSVYRPISKGASLKTWHVRDASSTRAGDEVSIVARKGGLSVEAPGKVLQEGEPGDRVRVLNVATGQEIYATIVDANTVSVSF